MASLSQQPGTAQQSNTVAPRLRTATLEPVGGVEDWPQSRSMESGRSGPASPVPLLRIGSHRRRAHTAPEYGMAPSPEVVPPTVSHCRKSGALQTGVEVDIRDDVSEGSSYWVDLGKGSPQQVST